ncbi:hypothetical protein J4230_01830 [Candidatus Woesearchaeota archaeon]|nr:hypothetical protein [Candidatus Woesearchaeota archaeon]
MINRIPVTVDEVKGDSFGSEDLPAAQAEVSEYYSGGDRFVAPLPLLLRRYPHVKYLIANSEEIVGVDRYGKYTSRGETVVLTGHGGRQGWGVLTPEVTRRALDLCKGDTNKEREIGLNKTGAVILDDLLVIVL